MGRTACTEPQCLYKGALYLIFICVQTSVLHNMSSNERVKSYLSPLRAVWPVQSVSACTKVHYTLYLFVCKQVSCTICPAMRESRELFKSIFPPCGLYGLYRASVPIQRCTLPYIHLCANKCLAQYVPAMRESRELFKSIFPPYGLYGLYRASVPIQRFTLPYIYLCANKFLAQYVPAMRESRELFKSIFPPYRLYGLYRASVPIQRFTLPYIYLCANKCLAQYVQQ